MSLDRLSLGSTTLAPPCRPKVRVNGKVEVIAPTSVPHGNTSNSSQSDEYRPGKTRDARVPDSA